MARSIGSIFITVLAFACGSFFTWTLTLYSSPESRSQTLARILDVEHREFFSDVGQNMQRWTQKGMALKRENAASTTSRNASKPLRVLCWVMTSPYTLYTRARSVRDTWGPRCDVTLYMSSESDPDFPAVGLDVAEGRDALWNKTKASVFYIYEHYLDEADWFMKADDDTYVIVENLRYFLREKEKENTAPVYYGHPYKNVVRQGYMSGGSGYVMNKEALRKLVSQLRNSKDKNCGLPDEMTYYEDVTFGQCMMKAGVLAGDSRDKMNRRRFIPLSLETFYLNHFPDWYLNTVKYPAVRKGLDGCSDTLISIHYVTDRMSMMILDYCIHGIRVMTSE